MHPLLLSTMQAMAANLQELQQASQQCERNVRHASRRCGLHALGLAAQHAATYADHQQQQQHSPGRRLSCALTEQRLGRASHMPGCCVSCWPAPAALPRVCHTQNSHHDLMQQLDHTSGELSSSMDKLRRAEAERLAAWRELEQAKQQVAAAAAEKQALAATIQHL